MNQMSITFIDQYIYDGQKAVLSLKNFYDTILVSDQDNRDHIFRIPIHDFFLKYRDQLQDAIQVYDISEEYFYKPKKLSLDLYGTTELWLSLLRINNMVNISEFHMPIIQVYHPDRIRDYINIFFKRERKII